MPIHDQGYRRYGGGTEAKGQAWLVIARAGIRTMVCASGCSWRCCCSRGCRSSSRVRPRLSATNFSQVALLAPTAQTFREFLEQQELFVFFITIYVGAGLIATTAAPTRCRSTCRSR